MGLQTIILLTTLGSALGSENFAVGDLARARGEMSSEESTIKPSPTTCNLVWKVTATTPKTRIPTVGTIDHGVIMDTLHYTMMDYDYRQMWMSLMRHSYPLFLSELKNKGPAVFIKPKYPKKQKVEPLFEGKVGEQRWQFLIDYFTNMDLPIFERILELFDYERHKYEAITFSTFASPPLPTGYWDITDPTYWQRFTEKDEGELVDPWKYTVVQDQWSRMQSINPHMFTGVE